MINVEKIKLNWDKRILAISDIHGNYQGLCDVLQQASYLPGEDQLLVIGDLIEKGPQSLKTLHYCMELAKKENVYFVAGNCEVWMGHLLRTTERMMNYFNVRSQGLMYDLAKELKMTVNEYNVSEFIRRIKIDFEEELAWLASLPLVLEDERLIVVHGGIDHYPISDNTIMQLTRQALFENTTLKLDRMFIVGHYPTVNYCHHIPDCGPRINFKTKVMSIDGGNMVKPDGQLNLVEILNKDFDYQYYCYEDSEVMIADHDQQPSKKSYSITWSDNRVIVLQEKQDHSFIRHLSSGYEMWVHNSELFWEQDQLKVMDVTDYRLQVNKGDKLFVYNHRENRDYVKKKGILGWYEK